MNRSAPPETEAAPSDGELARRVSVSTARDVVAERALCERMLPRVRIFLARHHRDPYAVEDASHDALIALLEALRSGRLDDPDRVGSYVLGICRNLTRQGVRRDLRRHRALLREDAGATHEMPVPRLRIGRLEECLHFLREPDRVLLRLTFCDGSSAGAAAEVLGITPENARVRRHRAIDGLRRCLGVGRYEVER